MLKSLAAICLVSLGLAPITGHARAVRSRIAAPGATRDLDRGLQGQRAREDATTIVTVLRPARVFDGETTHEGWAVRVKDDRVDWVGPAASMSAGGAGVKVVDPPGTTLMPGLVEGHSHVLLHPYNETSWNDQVAPESPALPKSRGCNHRR